MGGEFEAETRQEGYFLFESLPPDHYHLSFATTDGRFASLSGIVVAAGHETGDLMAKVVPGGKLSIRYEGQKEGATFKIRDGSILLGFVQGIASKSPKLSLVPAGRVTIEYSVTNEFAKHMLTVDVGVGETREVVLRDDG